MKRIHIHWTAGGHKANAVDRRHYHFIVEADGDVVPGDKLPEANLDTSDGDYAAHTRAANTGAIGVAFAAMHSARERPFNAGPAPITQPQLEAMAELCADLADGYEIPVTRQTVLTHAEIEPTLGVKQRGKWDVTWLPGMTGPGDPIVVGDRLRDLIIDKQRGPAGKLQPSVPPAVKAVIADADKGVSDSSTVWAAVRQWGGAGLIGAGAWWSQQSEATQVALIAAVVVLGLGVVLSVEGGVKTIRERIRKAKLGRIAKEAFGL